MMKNKMMITIITVSIINLIISFVYILSLPDIVPMHYDANMVCDSVGSKWLDLIMAFMPLIGCAMMPLMMRFAKNHEKNRRVISISTFAMSAFFILIDWYALICAGSGAAIGEKGDVGGMMWLLCIAFGALMTVVGNFFPIIKQNGMLGLRVKWTLENENCWRVTHRFTGRLMVVGGIIFMAFSMIMAITGAGVEGAVIALLVFVTAVTVPSVIYAYIHRNDKDEGRKEQT